MTGINKEFVKEVKIKQIILEIVMVNKVDGVDKSIKIKKYKRWFYYKRIYQLQNSKLLK